MKHMKALNTTLLSIALLAFSCKKEETPIITINSELKDMVHLTDAVGYYYEFTSTENWSIDIGKEGSNWLLVNPLEGEAGECKVLVRALFIKKDTTRIGEFHINAGEETVSVKVKNKTEGDHLLDDRWD